MPVIEKQVILFMFAMGILGGVGYYIWYLHKRRLACNQVQPSAHPLDLPTRTRTDDSMEEPQPCRDVSDNMSAKVAKISLQTGENDAPVYNRRKPRVHRQLGIYLPPHARTASPSEAAAGKSHPPLANPEKRPVTSTSLPATTPSELTQPAVMPPNEAAAGKSHSPLANPEKRSVTSTSLPAATPSELTQPAVMPPNEAAAGKSHSPLANPEKRSVTSSSLSAATLNEPTQPVVLPPATTDVKYLVTVHIPLWLVSKFIGRQGCNVKSLAQQSGGAEIKVQRQSLYKESSHTGCNITGSPKQIEAALELIRQRFPEVKVPGYVNMKLFHGARHKTTANHLNHSRSVYGIAPAVIPSTQFLASVSYVKSISSVWINVVSSPGTTCPWQVLYEKMNTAYAFATACIGLECKEEEDGDREDGKVAVKGEFYALKTDEGNFERVLLKEALTDEMCTVFLVDRGDHINVTADRLVPLRINHMELPAAAIEVSLAGIEPCPGFDLEQVRKVITNCVVQVHICNDQSVMMYRNGDVSRSINDELVTSCRGVARRTMS